MLFPTPIFAIFFVVVLVGAWTVSSRPVARKLLLIGAGAVFYGYWNPRFIGLVAGFVLVNWATAHRIERAAGTRRRALLGAGVAAELLTLGVFKYFDFFSVAMGQGLARLGIHASPPLLGILLPLGLSFYTLESVSYLVDVHRGRAAARSLLDVATWLFFFPKLASGPITRAVEFMPQLATRPDAARVEAARAYWLIARGLLKKLVVASFLSTAITARVFGNPGGYSSLTVLVGIYAYAAQIYADFSGYTDMAIGLALLLGFRLPENFDRPYAATSVQDFWSRWHMTLSRWLRDYLFAPVVGRGRTGGSRVYLGIVGVMLLAGLWHGAGWPFVAFGAVHGTGMALERWRRQARRAAGRPPPLRTPARQVLRRVGTFQIVCLGWVFFGSQSMTMAGTMLRSLVTNWSRPVTSVTPLLVLTIAGVIGLQYLPPRLCSRAAEWALGLRPVLHTAAFASSLSVILALAPTMVPAFIYFRF